MVVLAFSLQDQVEKYGAYVGIASFFGLAVLSLLYFARAREVRRLSDWAGRSRMRAHELEERLVAQAEACRRGARLSARRRSRTASSRKPSRCAACPSPPPCARSRRSHRGPLSFAI